jgi:hypothetical protein
MEHLLVCPIGFFIAAIPITPLGLGTFETAMVELYRVVPSPPRNECPGIVLAGLIRVWNMLIALSGGACLLFIPDSRTKRMALQP